MFLFRPCHLIISLMLFLSLSLPLCLSLSLSFSLLSPCLFFSLFSLSLSLFYAFILCLSIRIVCYAVFSPCCWFFMSLRLCSLSLCLYISFRLSLLFLSFSLGLFYNLPFHVTMFPSLPSLSFLYVSLSLSIPLSLPIPLLLSLSHCLPLLLLLIHSPLPFHH